MTIKASLRHGPRDGGRMFLQNATQYIEVPEGGGRYHLVARKEDDRLQEELLELFYDWVPER